MFDLSELREKILYECDADINFLMPAKVNDIVSARLEHNQVSDVDAYVRLINENQEEYQTLREQLFMLPDEFFADALLTSLLELRLLPVILNSKSPGDRIRVWIPQCGKGYLVYEVAIIMWKLLLENTGDYDIKILGTDSSPENVLVGRRQWFTPDEMTKLARLGIPQIENLSGPALTQFIRGMVVMGEHDPVQRPPYPNMDLILCMGYLPLLDRGRRGQVRAKFVHSLTKGSFLLLGRGEIMGLGEEAPSAVQPFPIFTKHIERPFELRRRHLAGPSVPTSHTTFLDSLKVPAFVLGPAGTIETANTAASRAFGTDGRFVGMDVRRIQPPRLFAEIINRADQVRQTGQAVRIPSRDGWSGGVAVLPVGAGTAKALVIVLVPGRMVEGLSHEEEDRHAAAREETALDIAKIVADMWAYDQEISLLREQTAIVTEGLYTETEKLAALREELESRNAELAIINEDLQRLIVEREHAEAEVRRAYDREHRIAETLQRALLTPLPEDLNGFQVAARYSAGREEAEIGGDFYHGEWLRGDRYYLSLGDVSGKGLEAAVYAYMTKYMQLGFVTESAEPDELLFRLNNALHDFGALGQFVTLVYLLLDTQSCSLQYGNGGHEPVVICKAATGETTFLGPTGGLLGVERDMKYSSESIQLNPGDLLLVYTDGISEAGTAKDQFGRERIAEILSKHRHEEPAKILDVLYRTVTSHSNGILNDDATSILIKCGARSVG